MGFRKFIKKVGKAINYKKTLPMLAGGAAALMGAPALGGMISKIGGSLGAGSAQQAAATDPAGAISSDWGDTSQVAVNGSRGAGFDWQGAIGAVAPIASGALNYIGQKSTNVANAQQAQAQMDFQNQQSSTSYQRGVEDMKKAGLNPMLAYSQGGAASGGGAQATMGNELGAGANSALSTAQTVQQMKLVSEQVEQTRAQTNYTDAQSRQADAQTLNLTANTKNLGLEGITKEIYNRYGEDIHRTGIRLGNSAARLNELRQPQQEMLGKGSDLVTRGLDSISSARDALAEKLQDWTKPDAENDLRDWANTRKRKGR